MKGKIAWFNKKKDRHLRPEGIGVITSDENNTNYFVSLREIKVNNIKEIFEGARVEFESIYRIEAKERQKESGKQYGEKHPKSEVNKNLINLSNKGNKNLITFSDKGRMTECMARDAETNHSTVRQVVYIKDNDKNLFEELKKQCQQGGDRKSKEYQKSGSKNLPTRFDKGKIGGWSFWAVNVRFTPATDKESLTTGFR